MMIAWIGNNIATIAVGTVLLLLVVLIIIKLHKDKKQGKHSCGGNCAGCNLCHHHDDTASAKEASDGTKVNN